MPSLVIKNLPADLHRKLKSAARREHRSMIQQAVAILSRELREVPDMEDFAPVKGAFPLTDELLAEAKEQRR